MNSVATPETPKMDIMVANDMRSDSETLLRTVSLVDSNETVTLSWDNINVYVDPPSRSCCRGPDPIATPKHVLKDVYGYVSPGTLLAIIGASGAGKTTLLNYLTSRMNNKAMKMSGDIRVNGVNVGRGIRNISAYVRQDDLFVATMTVREHLTFRALLRMERELPRSRRLARVEEVMTELSLTKCANNVIGDQNRLKGISGGEMRRLSFATEILSNPPLLFCDEPTSGLDAYMAENIIASLQSMAKRGKTILCTIHQPSSEVFALFDNVMILAEGRVGFMGPSEEALKFYESVGYPCPVNFNPADFYVKTMAVVPGKENACKARIETICDAFAASKYHNDIVEETNKVVEKPSRCGVIYDEAFSSTSRYQSPWCLQFLAVFVRCWRTTLREPMVIRVRLAQTVLIGLILSLIYLQLEISQQGVMDVNGVLFLCLTNMTFSNLFGVLNTFPVEVPVFLREYGIGLYRVDVYFVSKMLAELPSFIIIPVLFCSLCYWMVGLYPTLQAYLVFTGVILLVANIAVSFGYIISTAANSVTTALALAPPLMIPLMMFGGFFLNAESIPPYFIWLEHLSWFKYANELIAINQWQHVDSIDCPPAPGNFSFNPLCFFRDGDAVIKYLNFDKTEYDYSCGQNCQTDNQMMDLILLFVLLISYRIIAFCILFIKAKHSKN